MNNKIYSKGKSSVKSGWQVVLNYFLRGLLVLLPIAMTVGIIIWIVSALGNLLHVDDLSMKHFFFYSIGILAFILFVGFITRGVVAQQILSFFEGIIDKAPGLSFIFGTTRDVTEAFVGDKKKFTEPVMVKMGDGVYKMGFVTQKTMSVLNKEDHVTVYLPFCYSIAGEMVIAHKDRIEPVNAEPHQVTKFIISGGVASLDKDA